MQTAPFASAADEYDALRIKRLDYITGGDFYDTNDPEIAKRIKSINSYGQSSWNGMEKSAGRSYLWSVFASPTSSAHIVESYNKLLAMAKAYRTRGAALYLNTSLRDDILSALDWLYVNRFNENSQWYDNWWSWDIGAPMALTDICILMYDDFPTRADMERLLKPVLEFCGDTEHYHHYPKGVTSGANRTWKCINFAKYGILMKDSGAITKARDTLGVVFDYVTRGDGFYRDGSFIQHTAVPEVGGYGLNQFCDTTNMLYLLGGSRWAFDEGKRERVCEWAFNAFEPYMYKGALLIGTAEGLYYNGNRVIESLIMLGDIAGGGERAALKSMAKALILEDKNYFSSCSSVFGVYHGDALLKDQRVAAREDFQIYKQFPGMDRVVMQRGDYAFTVNMHSERVYNYESVNNNNLKGWHTGDGMTSLFTADTMHYMENYWATVDCFRLPGTTVNAGQTLPDKSFGRSAWAGGADMDNLYGVSGMELALSNQTLTAKKSWFMFDDEIVALGSGIWGRNNSVVETVIDNRRLTAGNSFFVSGAEKPKKLSYRETLALGEGAWAYLDGNVAGAGVGYYFPQAAEVHALRERREGAWSEYKSGGSQAIQTNDYLTLWFDHGINAADSASYAYAILPAKGRGEVGAYAEDPDIEIIENSTEAHAVYEKNLKITAVNFWHAGAVSAFGKDEYIKSDGKAAVMVKNEENAVSLSVSDPAQWKTGYLEIELDEAADAVIEKSEQITVISLSPKIRLSVAIGGSYGETFKARFLRRIGGISFENSAGEPVSALPEGGVFARCPVSEVAEGTVLILAVYDGGGALKDVSVAAAPEDREGGFDLLAGLGGAKAGDTVKAFVWDMAGMSALSAAAVLE